MSASRKWIVGLAALGAILLLVWFFTGVAPDIGLEPVRAFVAIQTTGSDTAQIGAVDLEAGDAFQLHAVVEARRRGGDSIYFTEAPSLRLEGRSVEPGRVRRWSGDGQVQVLWFTVEAARPYREISSDEEADRVRLEEFFRPDWPRAWSVPGSLQPARSRLAEAADGTPIDFGTQRYHVRVEFFAPGARVAPELRLKSPGAADVEAEGDGFPTVVARLSGPARVPSEVFGLPQVELSPGAPAALRSRLVSLFERRLAFSRTLLLRETVAATGRRWEEMTWSPIDLAEAPRRSEIGAAAGDLLRVGSRVVVLAPARRGEDALGYDSLCLDYLEGAVVRPLSDVFGGAGLVEWASLSAVEGQ